VARVLITGFCAVPGPTRAGVQLRHVVRALSGDHTVDLLVVRDQDQAYVERQGNVRILRVPSHDTELRAQVSSFQRALRRQLDGADYDVVHCRDPWSCRTVLDSRSTFGFAVVLDLTRAPWVDPAIDPQLAAELDRDSDACIAEADLVLVPTEPARRHAVARTRPEKVLISPPGVDVDRFDWDEAPHRPGPPRVLYAGAIEAGRGVRTLLRAMLDVVKATPSRLVLAGPVAPGFSDPLAAAIRELGLGEYVDVDPPVDHDAMPRLIAGATVCVAPAAPDLAPRATALYPTKLLEFMACKRAVVAPRRGTVAMLIDHGREGMLFQPGDPGDLARKLLRLLQDEDLRARMAQHGYERVRREFTASGARRAVRTAYQSLAERPQFRQRFADAIGTGSLKLNSAAALAAGEPVLGDDDFEATVFEGPPTGEHATDSTPELDAALEQLDADARTGDNHPVTEERELAADETAERMLDRGRPTDKNQPLASWKPGKDSGAFTALTPSGGTDAGDDWVVGRGAAQNRTDTGVTDRPEDDGTPVDVEIVVSPLSPDGPPSFVAGEIDVPTPSPEALEDEGAFTAASSMLGPRPDG
jgi:glycosyltransferase involved in cell wall biosynthesis